MGLAPSPSAGRLVSLDAYRGFIMLAMASGGFAFAHVAKQHPDGDFWQSLAYQFDHVAWAGCSFWDLIQPSFMFMVGVALPFSHASRMARGQSTSWITVHVFYRAAVLILLGIFLSSNWSKQTNFTFVNVLTQIGLGYAFVYCLVGRGKVVQLTAALLILGVYWYLFYRHAVPPPGFDWRAAKIPDAEGWETGLFAHWNKHTNFAAAFDRQFLAIFPYSESYPYNKGGYQTLNFVPSMATMIFGLMAGELLRGPGRPGRKLKMLFLTGALCLGVGLALSYTVCPLVKRIWTPSWAIFSTGWTLWMLAAFYGVIDVAGLKGWAFPFVVVGMNSIAMYCMAQLMKGWVGNSLKIHIGYVWGRALEATKDRSLSSTAQAALGDNLFGGTYGPVLLSVAVLTILWLICYWLYKRGIFLRI